MDRPWTPPVNKGRLVHMPTAASPTRPPPPRTCRRHFRRATRPGTRVTRARRTETKKQAGPWCTWRSPSLHFEALGVCVLHSSALLPRGDLGHGTITIWLSRTIKAIGVQRSSTILIRGPNPAVPHAIPERSYFCSWSSEVVVSSLARTFHYPSHEPDI